MLIPTHGVDILKAESRNLQPPTQHTKAPTMPKPYNYRWQQERKHYLANHPLCVYCMAQGKVTPANVVDHIVPHKGDDNLFWDASNWQALCKSCHDSVKQSEERGKARTAYGVDGLPIGRKPHW